MKSVDLITKGLAYPKPHGKRVEADNEGLEMIHLGFEEVETWPKYCIRYGHCIQCHLEGKILCAPRFRE